MNLREFRINDASIHYADESLPMNANLEHLNLLLDGNFSGAYTDMHVKSEAKSLTVDYDGVRYLKNATVALDGTIGADLENSKYTMKDNGLRINDLDIGMDGTFAMPSDTVYEVDMKYYTKKTDFKAFLSLIPAVYMQDFSGLKASGTASLDGTVKGRITDTVLPGVTMNLSVNNGHFSYPDLPKSADNIQMDLKIFYDGADEDNTTVDLNRFHMEMAGNPVDMNFHIITPFSDMQMNGAVSGKLDLASVADVIPLDSMKMKGIITANLKMMGKMSDIENANYEAVQAEGDLEVSGMVVSGGEVPEPVKIEQDRGSCSHRNS